MSHASALSNDERPLAESINAATRGVHAQLNRLIMARLPLALPPHVQDPSIYLSGLLHITPIYSAFESAWQTLLRPLTAPEPSLRPEPAIDERTRSLLSRLYLPALMRSGQLRADIYTLTGWAPHHIEEQLAVVSQSGPLAEFTQHISSTIRERPHVLLAYAHTLFMALFAGGRFIRSILESVPGDTFWSSPCSDAQLDVTPTMSYPSQSRPPGAIFSATHQERDADLLPLAFFRFSPPTNGENLKGEFKERLASVESLLTPSERHDIVQEAICIFDNMLSLVAHLDSLCGTPGLDDAPVSGKRGFDGTSTSSTLDTSKSSEKFSWDPVILPTRGHSQKYYIPDHIQYWETP
ncbi:heme oxygenase-like protein [Sodiomyces alkalinus F11]|uniref:Heme oxygenase-like protein n=1 Tax=Sodiomyces alkalinus (strain CBS 110278 / VKM F-3762 / F11) TaxID=1314773 RepID=A0A3N2Q8P9_SODAK|nr:heme oxygenase-like protein [Sodiomyces alkalinus F11]ROT43159.1 heme oxygenase-like protein [Sodiomyces alkalinus F11]